MDTTDRAVLDLCRQLTGIITDAAPLLDRNGVSAARLLTANVDPARERQGVKIAAWFARPLATSLAGLVMRMKHAIDHGGVLTDTRTWGATDLLRSAGALRSDILAVVEVEDAVWRALMPHMVGRNRNR